FSLSPCLLVSLPSTSPRTWAEHRATTDLLIESFGKQRLVADLDPEDFSSLRNKMARKWGPSRLAKIIQYTRSAFLHAPSAGLTSRPLRFGPG
ncbi:MAG: hypothetical protein L0Z62_46595, partial [Gemmataceae bacterium]|nr:hypothetical protein [Gemmataceae bacterium]